MKLRSIKRAGCGPALACALGVFLAGEADASALGLNVGGEIGAGVRTGTTWGPIVGGHLELNPIAGLHIGAYFSDLLPDSKDISSKEGLSFVSVGGRIRYLQPLTPKLRLSGQVGLGYVYAEYPGYDAAPSGIVNPTVTQQLGKIDLRSGNFLELPVGLGLAYSAFAHSEFTLSLAYRPGFSFKGSAYEGEGSYTQPKQGFSAAAGLSFFF